MVFDYKYDDSGNITRYKARYRLVAKGFQQRAGIDYDLHGTFAAVMKYKSLRVILALVAIFNLMLVQMDVVTAFLNSDIKEEVYLKQPQGYQPSSVVSTKHCMVYVKHHTIGIKHYINFFSRLVSPHVHLTHVSSFALLVLVLLLLSVYLLTCPLLITSMMNVNGWK